LKVTGSDKVFYPWKLDRDHPAKAATKNSKNDVDNIEVVLIENPSKNSSYTISVSHEGPLTGGSQDFSIVISPVSKPVMPLPSDEIIWVKNYGGSNNDYAYEIVPASEEGYFVTGRTVSANIDVHGNRGDSDFWILKLNNEGDTLWTKTLGGSYADEAFSILQTSDGGCAVVGSTFSSDGDVVGNNGESDVWIVKMDCTGKLEKTITLGGGFYEAAYSIIQTVDSGFVIAGCASSTDGDVHGNKGSKDGWVVKLDHLGDTVWTRTYGGFYDDELKSVAQTNDGGFILAGSSRSNNGDVRGNHGGGDSWVLKIDSKGEILWSKALGGNKSDEANSVCQTSDGGFVMAGYTHSSSVNIDMFIVKLNSSGEVLWNKSIGGAQTDIANSIVQSYDGGYWLAGYSESDDGDFTDNSGERDGILVKLNSNGSIIWSKNLGGSSHDELQSVKQMPDSSLILVGFSHSFYGDIPENNGHSDFWVMRLKPAVPGMPGYYLSSPQQLGTSGHTDVALGDIDKDGDLDAVVTKNGTGEPNKVWLNDGYGNFTDSGLSFGNDKSWGIALGDLDNDGDLDGFVANNGANKVYLNKGNNTTDNGQNLGTSFSRDVALGDIDGDGDLDAVVANSSGGQANKIWLNNGNGYFTAFSGSFGNGASYGVALGDLDFDGDLDGFVANIGANKVYLNNGINTTDNGQMLGNSNSLGVSLGDMDSDGDLDAVVANDGSGQPNRVWLNNGHGSFINSGLKFGTSISMDVALGDIDGDGDLDGFVANNGPNKIYLNDGAATTDNGQSLGNSNSYGVALGDMDGDGDLDAFVANYDGPCKVWFNQSQMPPAGQSVITTDSIALLNQFNSDASDWEKSVVLENYPNPFTRLTTIHFRLSTTAKVIVKLTNLYGTVVEKLFDSIAYSEQEYMIEFNAEDLPGGIYVIQLESDKGIKAHNKMMLLK
jgi:hypothetical protein